MVFDEVFHPDGSCGVGYCCFKEGMVLAYDPFSPEVATWFCQEHWQEYAELGFTVIETKQNEVERACTESSRLT